MIRTIQAFLILALLSGVANADTGREVIEEINIARTNPRLYVQYLEEWKSRYDGLKVRLSGKRWLQTCEDEKAVEEAIDFMKKRRPIKPLAYSQQLGRAAHWMVNKQGPAGQTGHAAPDGRRLSARANLFGIRWTELGENIAYGLDEPRQIVMMWIIDDGVPGREHRDKIFKESYRAIGAALGPHKNWRFMCVVDFAN